MDDKEFIIAMNTIVEALEERGYDPYAQLTGYIKEGKTIYITSYKGARNLITSLDLEKVKQFVKTMK